MPLGLTYRRRCGLARGATARGPASSHPASENSPRRSSPKSPPAARSRPMNLRDSGRSRRTSGAPPYPGQGHAAKTLLPRPPAHRARRGDDKPPLLQTLPGTHPAPGRPRPTGAIGQGNRPLGKAPETPPAPARAPKEEGTPCSSPTLCRPCKSEGGPLLHCLRSDLPILEACYFDAQLRTPNCRAAGALLRALWIR